MVQYTVLRMRIALAKRVNSILFYRGLSRMILLFLTDKHPNS